MVLLVYRSTTLELNSLAALVLFICRCICQQNKTLFLHGCHLLTDIVQLLVGILVRSYFISLSCWVFTSKKRHKHLFRCNSEYLPVYMYIYIITHMYVYIYIYTYFYLCFHSWFPRVPRISDPFLVLDWLILVPWRTLW